MIAPVPVYVVVFAPMKTLTLCLSLVGFASLAFAQKATIEGQALDRSNRPLKNAEVILQSETGKSKASFQAKTDAKGHFAVGLPAGAYTVSVNSGGKLAASLQHVRAAANSVARINLGGQVAKTATTAAAPAGKKRWVWVPAQTGSRIGGGWQEVTEANTNSGLRKADEDAFTRIQTNNIRTGSAPGGQ